MTSEPRRTQRRTDALSKAQIVDAAVEILDVEGESALTFRALGARLATGSGAIYWHVADKSDLLGAATDDVIACAIVRTKGGSEPAETIRAIALGVFDAIDAHPWAGTQILREPWRPALLRIFDGIGRQLQALGVPQSAQFDTASALVNYIVGVAGQNAANARSARETDRPDRSGYLASVAAGWAQLDPMEYPFVRRMAPQLRDHDDREQFLAGVNLILAGARLT